MTRLSLRTRLLVGVIAVGMIGLLARRFRRLQQDRLLSGRSVDTQLQNADGALTHALDGGFGSFNFNANTPPGTYGAVFYPSGQVALNLQEFNGPVPALSKAEIGRFAKETIPSNGPPNYTS